MKYGDYVQGFYKTDSVDDTEITPLEANFIERAIRLQDDSIEPLMLVEVLDGFHAGMCGMVFKCEGDSAKGIQFADHFTRLNCAVKVIGHINDVVKKEVGS